jgi:hypothetical protein
MPSQYNITPTEEEDLNGGGSSSDHQPSRRRNSTPKLTAVVKGRDSRKKPWSETAKITSLSNNGAGLFMSQDCIVGRLVSLIMPMPEEMRSYDHDKRFYRIWGLVQYCYKTGGDEETGFHVGVALVGKDAPESYTKNCLQSYRIIGSDRHGLWKIDELDSSFEPRRAHRQWRSIDVRLFRLDAGQNTVASERTVTENVSETGASVFTDLRISVGDRLRFQTSSPEFTSIAVVRHRRIGLDDRRRIHIEFLEGIFPMLESDDVFEDEDED